MGPPVVHCACPCALESCRRPLLEAQVLCQSLGHGHCLHTPSLAYSHVFVSLVRSISRNWVTGSSYRAARTSSKVKC